MNFKLKNTNLSPTQIVSSDTSQKAIFNSDTIQNIPIESDTNQLVDNMTLAYNSNDNKWIYSLPFNSYVGQVYFKNNVLGFTSTVEGIYSIPINGNMILSNFSNGYTIIDNGLACIKYEGNLNNKPAKHTISFEISNYTPRSNNLRTTIAVIKNATFDQNGKYLTTGTLIPESSFSYNTHFDSNDNIEKFNCSFIYKVSYITNEINSDEYYLTININRSEFTFILRNITWVANSIY